MRNKSIFINSLNISTLFFLIFKRNLKIVYLLDAVDYFPNNLNRKYITERLISLIFNKEIVRVPFFEQDREFVWELNKKAIELLEKIEIQLMKNGFSDFLSSSFISEKSIIAFKALYLPHVYRKLIFLYQLDLFYKNDVCIDLSVYTSCEIINFDIYIDDDLLEVREYYCPFYFRFINFLKSIFFIIFSPFLIVDIFRKGIRFFYKNTQKFNLAIHLVAGFPDISDKENNFKSANNFSDAEILKNSSINPKSTLFVRHKWAFSENQKQFNSESIRKIGAKEASEIKNKIPLHFLLKRYFYWGYFLLSIKIIKNPLVRLNFTTILIYQRLISFYLNHELFCSYYQVDNFFSRDDYDPRSIMRTIVQNRFKLRHSGLGHSSFLTPKYIPFTLYLHYDSYYITGKGFEEIWRGFYENINEVVCVGTSKDKLILDAICDQEVSSRFNEKYNEKTTILFLISPMGDRYSPDWLYVEKFKDLHELLEINKDIHLILRPRSHRGTREFFDKFPKLAEYSERGRITCELDDFTTQELVAHTNILVAEDSSSVLLESLCRDDLFSVYYMVRYGYFRHQEGLVANNIEELKSMIMIYFDKGLDHKYMNRRRNEIAASFVEQPFGYAWQRISENIIFNQK
jgi:hypothetical protein